MQTLVFFSFGVVFTLPLGNDVEWLQPTWTLTQFQALCKAYRKEYTNRGHLFPTPQSPTFDPFCFCIIPWGIIHLIFTPRIGAYRRVKARISPYMSVKAHPHAFSPLYVYISPTTRQSHSFPSPWDTFGPALFGHHHCAKRRMRRSLSGMMRSWKETTTGYGGCVTKRLTTGFL